ncbi:MAG: hypothetical protein Q8Q73_08500, partial [Stagnimonas sp.]|nr:hypothetical protein [Stagnimonas sp.]
MSRLPRVKHWLPVLAGLVVMPVWQLAQAAVTVDQVPLTVQQSLAPNITLMLDDSGSMAWDVMPDHAYLSDNGTNGLVSSDVNGVYYNPSTTYTPPYNADGATRYTAYSFNSAPPNGFNPTSPAPVDIKSYDGASDSSGNGTTKPDFSNSFTINTPAVYQTTTPSCASGYSLQTDANPSSSVGRCVQIQTATASCPSGYTLSNAGTASVSCTVSPTTILATCPSGYSGPQSSGSNKGKCTRSSPGPTVISAQCNTSPYTQLINGSSSSPDCAAPAASPCASGYTADASGVCTTTIVATPSCPTTPSGYSLINQNTQNVTCQREQTPASSSTVDMFTYTVLSGGSYTRHYVGDFGSCALITASNSTPQVAAAVCHDDDATRQNVANWFSYYHTRILLAKSGLMNAFSGLESTVRFGFGSIDGGTGDGNDNYLNLPTSRYSYTDGYNNGTNYIATVAPFGNGSSGTQKAQFWNWVDNAVANQGTPLRQALGAVGQYYQTAQPWQTSSSDRTELACRQSYAILTTDGFWNDGDSDTALPSTPYTTNVDNLVVTTTTSTLDTRPAFCAAGYALNTSGSPNLGKCVQVQTATASCPSGYTMSNPGTATVACTVSPTTILATCPSTYAGPQTSGSNIGRCTRSSPSPRVVNAQCNTSPYTTLINGSSDSPDCSAPAASPCPSGYAADASGLCTRTNVATPSCPVASNPSSPSYSLTNPNTATVDCQRTITTSTSSSSVTNTGSNGQTYTFTAAAPYADSVSNTLADTAMYYWLSDLRPSLDNKVPTSTEDPAFWQHMTTFTLGLGFTPTNISPTGTTIPQIFNWANGGT